MTYEGLRLKLLKYPRSGKLVTSHRRKQLTNDSFTIISNNCWGGMIYESYNLPKQSPTVGLFFMAPDYIRFLTDLKGFVTGELRFIPPEESRWIYAPEVSGDSRFGSYPVGVLSNGSEQVEVFFLHAHSREEAREKWERRCGRIHWDNLLVKFNDQNGCTEKELDAFLNLPYPNKVFLTCRDWKRSSREIITVPRMPGKDHIMASQEPFGKSKYLNVTNLLNDLQSDSQKSVVILSRALTYGGAERTAAILASYLNEHYHTTLVVIDGENQTYECTAPVIDLQQSVIRKGSGLNRIHWFAKLYRSVKRIRKETGADCVISFLTEPELVNALTAGIGKSVTSIRNVRSCVVKGRLKKIRDQWIFGRMDRIVSLSINAKKDLELHYGVPEEKIDVIYNICDRDRIRGEIASGQIDDADRKWFIGEKTFITTGRLSDQKAQWHMIRAFSAITEDCPDARLVILGRGTKEAYLRELIGGYGLEDRIGLLGFKENPYVYLANADCFVFSSVFEGLGNSIVEAMACGIPIISTDCNAGPRELLAPDTDVDRKADGVELAKYGILTPVCDGTEYTWEDALTAEERCLADAMHRMYHDEALRERYKAKASERGRQFTKEEIITQWMQVIDR